MDDTLSAAAGWPLGIVTSGESFARAFEDEIDGSTRLAFRVAYAVLRQREDAEDVAQEVVVKAYRSLRSLRDPGRLRPWLVRMAFRRALDRRRADQRRERREQHLAVREWSEPTSPPGAEDTLAAGERERQVWDAIDALPEKLRLALVLSALEGRAVAEVARLLEVPEGTVKSRLHLARKALLKRLR